MLCGFNLVSWKKKRDLQHSRNFNKRFESNWRFFLIKIHIFQWREKITTQDILNERKNKKFFRLIVLISQADVNFPQTILELKSASSQPFKKSQNFFHEENCKFFIIEFQTFSEAGDHPPSHLMQKNSTSQKKSLI